MGNGTVLLQRDGAVATVILNRAQAMNSLTLELTADFGEALAECESNSDIRAVIVTGNGRGFCAGADVADLATRSGNEATLHIYRLAEGMNKQVMMPMRRMAKPLIAAINGVAAGAGIGISLCCDLRVAVDSAKFVVAYSNVAICPDCATSYYLPRVVGPAKAMEMYLLNEPLTAEQALNLGILNRVVAAADLMPTAMEMAQKLAQGPTIAYGLTKDLLDRTFCNDFVAQLQDEATSVGVCGATKDHVEGVAAFVGKRKPQFKGQ